jgi:environmental stress-induced protein Ves
MNTIRLEDCPYVPWRNDGGRTRELLRWPSAASTDDWQLRVSVAEIHADGPFSHLPGIDRCFAVLGGAGVVLCLPGGELRLTPHDDALTFAGEAAPMCRLIAGPTHDLNLMVRRGTGTARMQRTPLPGRWRGVYADGTLWWSDDPHEPLPTLLPPIHAWHLSA